MPTKFYTINSPEDLMKILEEIGAVPNTPLRSAEDSEPLEFSSLLGNLWKQAYVYVHHTNSERSRAFTLGGFHQLLSMLEAYNVVRKDTIQLDPTFLDDIATEDILLERLKNAPCYEA